MDGRENARSRRAGLGCAVLVVIGMFAAVSRGYAQHVTAWSNDTGLIRRATGSPYTSVVLGSGNFYGIHADNSLVSSGGLWPGRFKTVSSGPYHTLAIQQDGTLTGWGQSREGQLGCPTGTFTAVACGQFSGLGIRTDGTLAAWGNSDGGATNVPAGTYVAIAAGFFHALAIRTDGTLAAWGMGGNPKWNPRAIPPGTFKQIDCGWFWCLGLRTDGTLAAWGRNDEGECSVPAGRYKAIACGKFHGLALRDDGTLAAWGANNAGQTNVPPGVFAQIAAGGDRSLAIRAPQSGLGPITSSRITPDATGWTRNNVTVTLEAATTGAGVAAITYGVFGAQSLDQFHRQLEAPWRTARLGLAEIEVNKEGSTQIQFFSTETAGNSENVRSISISIDRTLPATRIETRDDDRVVKAVEVRPNVWELNGGDPVEVTFVPEDTLSGIRGLSVACDNPSRIDDLGNRRYRFDETGKSIVTFFATDNAGNVEAPKTLIVNIGRPTLVFGDPIPAPNANGWNSTDVQIPYGISYRGTGIQSVSHPNRIMISGEGMSLNDKVEIKNGFGGIQPYRTPNINIDRVAPLTKASISNGILTLEMADATSGLAKTYYQVDAGPIQAVLFAGGPKQTKHSCSVPPGSKAVAFWSTDRADNVEAKKTLNL